MAVPTMLEDQRPIKMVNDDRAGQNLAVVGQRGVTKIVCYGEPGEHCFKPWLAVYSGDEIISRMDPHGLTIYY